MSTRLLIRNGTVITPVPRRDAGRRRGVRPRAPRGEIREGLEADIVLIRTGMINTAPASDPLAAVVSSADVSNVDTVLVHGKVKKRAGRLVGVDLPKLVGELEVSRDRVLDRAAVTG